MRDLHTKAAWLALLVPAALAKSSGFISGSSDSKIAKNVLESKGEGYCSPSGPIENTLCAYETLETLNKDLYPALHKLVQDDFFRYYKIDLYRECPFWYENGFCMNRDCGVETVDESQIPEKWRAKALSQVHVDDEASLPGCHLHSQDFCYTDSESSDEGQYFDLLLNPERFTGYAGISAHRVWGAIYEENCFGLNEKFEIQGGRTANPMNGISALQEGFGKELHRGDARDAECLEKRIYYRIISGMHASISVHICHEYLNQTTGEWHPNLDCFIARLASHPERLSNIYFNTVLLLRAIARAEPYLQAYDIETAKGVSDVVGLQCDAVAKRDMRAVLDMARDSGSGAFDEKTLFRSSDASQLRDEFKHNFRNVSRILDCIGCDKCRLWGKLQVSGLGTALKILFELDDKAFDPKANPNLLQRSEIVALFNTLHRMSESLYAIEVFRKLYAETQAEDIKRLEASKVKLAKPVKPTRKLKKKGSKSVMEKSFFAETLDDLRRYVSTVSADCRSSFLACWRHLEGSIGLVVDLFTSIVSHCTSGKSSVKAKHATAEL